MLGKAILNVSILADTTWNPDEPYLPLLPKLKNSEHANYCGYFKPLMSE